MISLQIQIGKTDPVVQMHTSSVTTTGLRPSNNPSSESGPLSSSVYTNMIGNAGQTFRTNDISFSPTATANSTNSSESNESPLFVCSWGFVAFLVGVIAASGIWLTIRSQRNKTEKEIELHTPVHTSTYGLEVVASPVHSGSNLQNQNFNVELSKYLKDTSPNTSPNDSNTIG